MNPLDKAINIVKFQEPSGTLNIEPSIISSSKIQNEVDAARK